MSQNFESLKLEIQRLPFHERAVLIQHLITDIDKDQDADCEDRWIQEAERRYQQWKEGKIPSRSSSTVFKEALAKFT